METNKKPRLDPGTGTGGTATGTSTSTGSTATGTIGSGTSGIGATATATGTSSGTIGIGTATGSTIGTATGTTFNGGGPTGTIGSGTIGTASGTSTGSGTIGIGSTIGSTIGTATGTSGTATGTTFNGGGPTADWSFDRLIKIASVDPAFRLWMVEMLADEDPHLIFRTVFVRGFGWDVSAETLLKAFEPYGHIVECRVAAGDSSLNPRCPGGIGFVVFETPESGFKATVNRHKVINNRLTHTQHPFPGRPCVTVVHPNYTPVYVRDVPENGGTFYQLQILFRQFGQIVFGPFWLQLPRNYVIIILMTAEQAAKAIEEPRKIISGREVQCFIESEAILEAAKKELMDQLEAAYTTNGHNPSSKTGLYVNHVHPELDDDKLKSFFAKFGEIVAGPIPFLLELYCSWRFALFLYKTPEEAENALLEAQDKMFDGYPLQCQASPDDFIEMAVMEEVKWCLLMAKSVVQDRAEDVAQRKVSYLRKISYPNSGS